VIWIAFIGDLYHRRTEQMAKGQLNAGSLGGRFLRRANPQKGQSVPSRIREQEVMETQAKQSVPEGNRRVRTSAAMIGLAVSVGAYGLPLPHQGEQIASATEPFSTDPTASNLSNSFETAAVLPVNEAAQGSPSTGAAGLPIKHTVQEGQTLWDVARFYGTDVALLASTNGLRPSSVIRVGQVLTIPVDARIAQTFGSTDVSSSPGYYGPVSGSIADARLIASSDQDVEFKANQGKALGTLRQKRENLRSGVAGLSTSNSAKTASTLAETIQQESTNTPQPAVSSPAQVQTPKVALVPQVEQEVAMRSSHPFSTGNQSSTATHQVRVGDTLSTIARANGVTVQQLLRANRISDPNYIFVGQTIVIPGQQVASQDKFTGAIAAVPTSTVSDVPTPGLVRPATVLPTNSAPVSSKVAAVTPFTRNTQAVESEDVVAPVVQYNRVDNLKLEIERLRERYQTSSNRADIVVQPETKVAVAPTASRILPQPSAERINPQFNSEQYSTRLQEIRDRLRPATRQTPSTPQAQPSQLVAVAPLGSENYDPIKSRLGRTVSPELPSLGTGSEFLPSVPGQANSFIWPAKGVLTSGYGWRWGRMHKGIDIAGPIGTPVVAAADGRVTYAGWNSGGYGYLVEITHPDGSLTLYAHNNRILVQVGQEVAQGQQISEMGSTGYSTGPHLHFEVHPTGKGAVNPIAFLPRG